jgi:hypothetical protein
MGVNLEGDRFFIYTQPLGPLRARALVERNNEKRHAAEARSLKTL